MWDMNCRPRRADLPLFNRVLQADNGGVLEVRDGLLGQVQPLGDGLVGPAENEQELETFQSREIAAVEALLDELTQLGFEMPRLS
jgi:hypothetical protein